MNCQELRFSAPGLMCVCVDGCQNSDIYGRIYSSDGILSRFRSTDQMLKRIEMLCDRLGYPQSSVKMRSFREEESCTREDMRRMGADENLLKHKGEEATFVVHVQYRQNATWQGQVTWAEKKQTMNFRSALELLKLMDSAVDDEEVKEIG